MYSFDGDQDHTRFSLKFYDSKRPGGGDYKLALQSSSSDPMTSDMNGRWQPDYVGQ
jgi:hypothetical protein